jgi:predicted CopG family antitoxin
VRARGLITVGVKRSGGIGGSGREGFTTTKMIGVTEDAYNALKDLLQEEQSRTGDKYSYTDMILGLVDFYRFVQIAGNGVGEAGKKKKNSKKAQDS